MQSKLIRAPSNKGRNPKALLTFLHQVKEALDEGWELKPVSEISMRDFPNFMVGFSVMMYKSEEEVVIPLDILEVLEDKSLKKDDLKVICQEQDIEYPEEIKQPASVRKHLKGVIKARRESVTGEGATPE